MQTVRDIPKLYTALAEWMTCMTMLFAYQRFLVCKKSTIAAGSAVFLALLVLIQFFCGTVTNALWLLGMLCAFLLMALFLKGFLGLSWSAALYLNARTFLWAEFLAALEWQLYFYYWVAQHPQAYWFRILCCVLFYALGCAALLWFERRNLPQEMERGTMQVRPGQNALVLFVTLLIFALSNISYISIQTPFSGSGATEIFNIRTLMDLAGVLMLDTLQLQKVDADRLREMTAIQNILKNQYNQFRQSQESMDLINRKYHDLKHQLQILREASDDARRAAYLDEIESGLKQVETQNKTGNTVLDTILTGKSEQCQKLGITLTVVANGTLLSDLSVMDLCTIFGNALDNAIECEAQQEDPQKRLIHVTVSQKSSFACVVVENYYIGSLQMDSTGKFPVTTKRDRSPHGYGLKSIRFSVEKYGGILHAGAENGWFRLEMLFPIRKEQETAT